jgi:hypothetical protein
MVYKEMSDQEFAKALREYDVIYQGAKELVGVLDTRKARLINEFDRRKIKIFKRKTVEGKIRRDPIYGIDEESIREDFTLEQLDEMDALNINLNAITVKGKTKKDIQNEYRTVIDTKAPILTVTSKPRVGKKFLRKLSEIFTYPVSD